MVHAEGLEPPSLTALASKTSVYTNFTTRARDRSGVHQDRPKINPQAIRLFCPQRLS